MFRVNLNFFWKLTLIPILEQNAEKSEEETSPPSSDADLPTSLADSFNDTTPYNGTIVDDVSIGNSQN